MKFEREKKNVKIQSKKEGKTFLMNRSSTNTAMTTAFEFHPNMLSYDTWKERNLIFMMIFLHFTFHLFFYTFFVFFFFVFVKRKLFFLLLISRLSFKDPWLGKKHNLDVIVKNRTRPSNKKNIVASHRVFPDSEYPH